jgi:HK97 family phage prohead protease
MDKKFLHVGVLDFKVTNETTGEFTCYGNVKNIIDHAQDRTVDGCFRKSIQRHREAGIKPKMFWMHNPWDLPVGAWVEMNEDEKGLFLKGRLSDTAMGRDIKTLAMDGALDSFSIGYRVLDSEWNDELKCNDLKEVDILEVSWVTFACNEESRLETIKSKVHDGETVNKADLRELLKSVPWLSKNTIEKITANYNPVTENDEIKALLESSPLFK